jgi:excisionase family DNA binding protein
MLFDCRLFYFRRSWEEIMDSKFKTIKQTAELLQVAPLTVWRKIQTGEIPATRLGRRVLIPDEFFDQLKARAFQEKEAV